MWCFMCELWNLEAASQFAFYHTIMSLRLPTPSSTFHSVPVPPMQLPGLVLSCSQFLKKNYSLKDIF